MDADVMKCLVKSRKVYGDDSGLLPALLDVRSLQQLAGHPVTGALWEGIVIDQLIGAKPPRVQASFYRNARGAISRSGVAQQPGAGGYRLQVFQLAET